MKRIALGLMMTLAALPALAANGVLSGVITGTEGTALPGALIRTEGEPGYSARSGSDGIYALEVPKGNYTILISSSGRVPQRTDVSVPDGSTVTNDFLLKSPGSGQELDLPAPLDWGEPPSAPAAPGESFPVLFADTASIPATGTPVISGWNDQVKPDESFTITGSGFTTRSGADAGTDTSVWVWARVSESVGVLRQAKLWKVTENTIVATLPDDIPYGMYLVWVENSVGAGPPVCINRTTPTWVGPLGNKVQAGSKKRVFGRNISHNRGTAAGDSFVYIRPVGVNSFVSCPVSTVNPYMVEFTVPAETANGDYKVYVHNGHGGPYGWGDALDLVVENDWVRGATEINMTPTGVDDTDNIQNAINQLAALPDGGTVNLSSGTFKTYDTITLKGNVRVLGAGMNLTTVELRLNSSRTGYLTLSENNVAIERLTLKGCIGNAAPTQGIITGPWPNITDNFKMRGVRVDTETGLACFNNTWGVYRTEMSGCEFYRAVNPGYVDGWLHASTLYGGPYCIAAPVTENYVGETEAAYNMKTRAVFEYSHVETKDWPINPANGSRNYTDFMTYPEYAYKVWAKRVALIQSGQASYNYIANLTTKDVAVQDNRGEMILFHGIGGSWFGNAISTDGLVVNVRTDGTVNGQSVSLQNYRIPNPSPLVGGQPVPDADASWYWMPTDGACAVIIAGRGVGQSRTVVSHTPTSITVDKPWRIAPDPTSVILVTTLYRDNVVYNNDLNAFPVGYTQVYSASCGVDIDANGWANSVEGNVSRRTYSGRSILAHSGGASYWNVMRNETALECLYAGLALFYWDTNPSGPVLLGNAFRDCAVSVFGSTDGGIRSGRGEGTILERTNITAKLGYNLSGVSGPGAQGSVPPAWQDGSALYRKGNVSAVDGSGSPSIPMPVYVSVADGKQLLVGNQYSGSAQNYFLATGLSPFSNPLPLYRVARFKGYVGHPVGGALIPVANAGTASMTWTVTTSDPWINASVQSNGTVAAESDAGRLAVSVDTTGMSASTHLGTLTLSNGTISIKIGVSVDLASGTPANAVPGAVFSMNPSGGAAPYTANFDALSSTDSDGVIASYYWDFGDGTYGSGVTASHTYSVPGTYTPVLTVTDDSGAASSAWSNIAVSPALSAVSLAGNPSPPVATGTPVTLSATATGGYQVQYKFLVNAGNGWTILRDYQTAQTCEWTPVKAGIYEVKVLAKNLGSVSDYDQESAVLSYPVGLVARSGLKLWLKADAGITTEGGLVSSWADQSGAGNTVVQGTSTYRPSLAENTLNGHPSVRFSGGNQSLQSTSLVLTGGTAFSTFAVFRFNSIPASTYQYTWFNGTDDASKGYGVYMSTLPKLRAAWGGSNGAVYNSTNSVVDQWYRLSSCFDGTNNRLWTNGAPMGTVAKTGSSLSGVGFCVGNLASGSTKGLRGDMSEILVYDRALSDSERAGIDAYLLVRWSATSAVIVERLADALALPDGTTIALVSPKVATVASGVYSDGSYYIEEPDRTCGIKVIGGSVALWDSVTLTGTVATDSNGERVVTGSSISTRSVGQEVRALGMTNRSMKPTGFLTRIWGRVSSTEAGKFTLDDASGAPVAVLTGGLVTPVTVDVQPGYYVAVTGLSGKGDGGITVIRPRGNSDITVFSQ